MEKPEVQINSSSVQEKTGLVGDEDHVVNWPGFLLLVEVFRASTSCDLLPISKVKLATGMLRIAGYVARQTKPVEKLTIDNIHCETANDGAACTADPNNHDFGIMKPFDASIGGDRHGSL